MGGSVASGGVVLMPTWKRAVITGIQLTMTLLTAGVIIGYGQLHDLLVDEGVYHSKCKPPGTPKNVVCPEQASALDQLFNIGASVSIFVQAPSGIILDFLGPRITCWAGLALFIPGCFVFAFAESLHGFDAYMLGFQLLAAGGPFVFISSLPVAELWPDKKAMILMMTNGVYGGGAFVFFLFSLLHYHAHISLTGLFIGYGVLGGLMVIVAGFVWPRRSYAVAMKPSNIQGGSSTARVDEPSTLEILQKSLKANLHKSKKDMFSVHFLYLALFVAFLVFKSNFFLSSYVDQFGYHMDASTVATYTTVFGVLLPGIGMLAGPIGILFDLFGVYAALAMVIVLSTISSICGLMVFSDSIFGGFQIVRMIVFSTFYPMIYGVWAFALIARYGNTNFGVLYGAISILAGIVNLVASDPVNKKALDKKTYVPVNFVLAIVGFVFILYPLVMSIYRCTRRHVDHLDKEGDDVSAEKRVELNMSQSVELNTSRTDLIERSA